MTEIQPTPRQKRVIDALLSAVDAAGLNGAAARLFAPPGSPRPLLRVSVQAGSAILQNRRETGCFIVALTDAEMEGMTDDDLDLTGRSTGEEVVALLMRRPTSPLILPASVVTNRY